MNLEGDTICLLITTVLLICLQGHALLLHNRILEYFLLAGSTKHIYDFFFLF